MKNQIQERFQGNIERVQALLTLYETSVAGSGRPPVHQADVLRAAVVFLHATLEDIVRSTLEWKLPSADAEHLEAVPLLGCEKRSKFTLPELAKHRGKTVAAVIQESVTASLAESSFNHPGDLSEAVGHIGVDPKTSLGPFKGQLGSLMKRRHWIVHRADRNTRAGSGHHQARSLRATTVVAWRKAVEGFGTALLAAL